MTRIPLVLLAVSGLVLAQDQAPGGWRRSDAPPAPPAATAPAPMPTLDTEPVDRSDEYGQPVPSGPNAAEAQPQGLPRRPAAPPPSANAYGLPAELTLRPGTYITARIAQPLSSDRNNVGDTFVAHLTQPIMVDGVVVAQRGQPVMGRVAEATKAGHAHGTSRLALQLTGFTLADGTQANVQSQLANSSGQTGVGNDVATVGAGGGVLLTRSHATVVYPETLLTFRIDSPVNVDLTRAPQAFRYVGPNEYDHPVQTTVTRRPATPGYYTPYPSYYNSYPSYYGYPGYYGYYPYAFGPSFGFGIGIRGGGWGRRW